MRQTSCFDVSLRKEINIIIRDCFNLFNRGQKLRLDVRRGGELSYGLSSNCDPQNVNAESASANLPIIEFDVGAPGAFDLKTEQGELRQRRWKRKSGFKAA